MNEIVLLVEKLEGFNDTELLKYFVEIATEKCIKYTNKDVTKEQAYGLYKSAIIEQARYELNNYTNGNNGSIKQMTQGSRSVTYAETTEGVCDSAKDLLPSYVRLM